MPKNPSSVARLVQSSGPEIEAPPANAGMPPAPFVGECIGTRHPVLAGRVCVRWAASEGSVERWVPTLRGVAVRERERVLLLQTSGEPDPIVVGVLDGFEARAAGRRGPSVELALDEVFTLLAENGQPLLEVVRNAEGPVVRLLTLDTQLELPGKLRIQASDIELSARKGSVRIEADDEVVVQGGMIRLN
jgi:hypothetical protein